MYVIVKNKITLLLMLKKNTHSKTKLLRISGWEQENVKLSADYVRPCDTVV